MYKKFNKYKLFVKWITQKKKSCENKNEKKKVLMGKSINFCFQNIFTIAKNKNPGKECLTNEKLCLVRVCICVI
jgi:hypothetical protein